MTQVSMFGPEQSKLEKAFWKFHAKHPEVYDILKDWAYKWRERRGSKAMVGIATLYELARWNTNVGDYKDSPRLSNNHRAYYARLLQDANPELVGIFRLRQQDQQATIGPSN
jgi:hypothetical protein